PVHDLGCTMKAIRRDVAQEIHLYGEMHRFIPILGHWRGARCVEIVARHHPRQYGKSKYGISRTLRVLLDLVTIKFLIQYLRSPMRLFGSAGLACAGVGLLSAASTIWMKLVHELDMTGNPLLLLSVFSMMAAVQLIGMGMLGELGARIYYESQSEFPYAVRSTLNFSQSINSSGELGPTLPLRKVA
ncbi:MAG: glycosyltransferase, partial [Planctomycetaceae bacterium]